MELLIVTTVALLDDILLLRAQSVLDKTGPFFWYPGCEALFQKLGQKHLFGVAAVESFQTQDSNPSIKKRKSLLRRGHASDAWQQLPR